MNKKSLTEMANRIIKVRQGAVARGGVIPPSDPSPLYSPHEHLWTVHPLPLTYKSETHTGAMIALFLPTSISRQFVLNDENSLPTDEMHITLANLGKANDLSSKQVNRIHTFLDLIAENHPPLQGNINGCGRFCNGSDEGDPFFIIPDLSTLPNLREVVVSGLNAYDIDYANDHGFTPHITLTYIPHSSPNPFDQIELTPVIFPTISLVLAGERFDYPFAMGLSNISKAALVEKIGARHTTAECELIQKMHDVSLQLGAECHPLTKRAGAKHSVVDQVMIQRVHNDSRQLGAVCKALPAKDEVYNSQVMKEGPIIKAQADAPNYQAASTPQRCKNCKFFLGDPGRDWCERFDFTADRDYHCDDWQAQTPDEIPGYVANKSLAALTEGILVLRGGSTSGNWAHAGRKGKRGGSGGGGGFKRIGVKPGSSRKLVKQAAKKKQTRGGDPKTPAKPKAASKKPLTQKELQKLNKKLFDESKSGKATPKKKIPPVAKKPTSKPEPAKKRAAKEDRVPKTDKMAAGDVKDAKATNNKTMSKNSQAWQKNMSAAELGGLQAYQGSQFQSINGGLRGSEKPTAASKKDVRNIDKALAKSPLKEDTVVFRSMDENTLEKLLGPDKKKWTGQGYSDKGYTSTSIDPGGTGGFRGIPMEIRVPKGTPAGYLANLPGGGVISAGEQELLLGRGQKFRILKVKGGRRPKIIAEVVKE